MSRNSNYYVRPGNEYEDGYLYIGEGFDTNPATCIITAKGYKPLTLTLDKSNHKVTIGAVEETTYKAYVEGRKRKRLFERFRGHQKGRDSYSYRHPGCGL